MEIHCSLDLVELAFLFAALEKIGVIHKLRGVIPILVSNYILFDNDYAQSSFAEALSRQRKILTDIQFDGIVTKFRNDKSKRQELSLQILILKSKVIKSIS